MNKETLDLIKQLADKLGVTADHLWGMLIKQARYTAICDLIIDGGVIIVAGSIAFYLGRKLFKEFNKNERDQSFNPVSLIIAVLSILIFIGGIINLCTDFNVIVSGFFNPEYCAFKQLWK